MRIISGTHRSRRILAPEGHRRTRPITDRVKQSLFDRLWSLGLVGEGSDPQEVLDLFSGTGSLGLEALSRGARRCTFVENDRSARRLLERNLQDLALSARATVLDMDALGGTWLSFVPTGKWGLIFCDPPYEMTSDERQSCAVRSLLGELAERTRDSGLLVLRTHIHTHASIVNAWSEPTTHAYGSTALHFYQQGK